MKGLIFDQRLNTYDEMIKEQVENLLFPYSEYAVVQETICDYLNDKRPKKQIKILDIGIGTALLYERILLGNFELYGLDQSEQMLEIARLKQEEAKLYQADIRNGLPEELKKENFDFIIISYLFSFLDFSYFKALLPLLKNSLAKEGKIIIADNFFKSEEIKMKYFLEEPKNLDFGLNFHVYNDVVLELEDDYDLSYLELNVYTGIIIIENLLQSTLQYDDSLVKYSENTGKWKSTLPEKKSE